MSAPKSPIIDRAQHCLRTYATVRIYPQVYVADDVTEGFNIQPTKIWRVSSGKPFEGWFLTSKGKVSSLNTLDHIAYILAILETNTAFVDQLIDSGSTINLINFWHSDGQGGPGLTVSLMKRLSRLNVEVDWNVYQEK